MSLSSGQLVHALTKAFNSGDARQLKPLLSRDVQVKFDVAGAFQSRHALLGFLNRFFRSYVAVEVRVRRLIVEDDLVIAELLYTLKGKRGEATSVRAVSVFEIVSGRVVSWTDHADLSAVESAERQLWQRLAAARW